MPEDFSQKAVQKALNDLESEGDRAAAIIAASLLELTMEWAIQRRLLPISKTLRDSLFTGYGPLSTFAAKIDVGFALGILAEEVHAELHLIRRIRNEFAHRLNAHFNNADIAKYAKQIRVTPKAAGELLSKVPEHNRNRLRFIRSVHLTFAVIVAEVTMHPWAPHPAHWRPTKPTRKAVN